MTTIGFASTEGACAWYRAELPARQLALRGRNTRYTIDVDLAPTLGAIGFPVSAEEGMDPDVVVLAAGFVALTDVAIRAAQEAGQRVICDCDDWPWLPRENPHWREGQGMEKVRALRAADAVTVSTPYLQRELSRRGVESTVIRNVIDPEPFAWAEGVNVERRRDGNPRPLVVAYRGLLAGFHDADVQSLHGSLPPGVAYVHVGSDPRSRTFASLAGLRDDQVENRQAVEFSWYPGLLAGVDLAIIPFANRPFSMAKSNIAGLEWSAAGVPWIAARHPEFNYLAEGGRADTARHFRDLVAFYTIDPADRAALHGRQAARIHREGLTENAPAAEQWADKWEEVIDDVLTGSRPRV